MPLGCRNERFCDTFQRAGFGTVLPVRDVKVELAAGVWGSLPVCATVGTRRFLLQTQKTSRLTIGRSLPGCPTNSGSG